MNRCDKCKLLDVSPCPLQEIAYKKGWEGLQTCEMGDAIDKMIASIKADRRFLYSREMSA